MVKCQTNMQTILKKQWQFQGEPRRVLRQSEKALRYLGRNYEMRKRWMGLWYYASIKQRILKKRVNIHTGAMTISRGTPKSPSRIWKGPALLGKEQWNEEEMSGIYLLHSWRNIRSNFRKSNCNCLLEVEKHLWGNCKSIQCPSWSLGTATAKCQNQ